MISAIIVNYHDHTLTAQAVASVLVDQPDAQVIVIDNSADAAEAEALRDCLPATVDYIVSPENVGFGRACNMGYARARYDLILLLNPDALIRNGCIAALVDCMRKTPDAGAVSPLAVWDDDAQWLLSPSNLAVPLTEFGLALAVRVPWVGRRVSLGFRRWVLNCIGTQTSVRQRMLSGGHILVRRDAVEKTGGLLFDPAFFMYFEDTDLCIRLQQAGYSLYLLPQATAVHAWCATRSKSDLAEASYRLYFGKHFSDSRFLRLKGWIERVFPTLNLPLCRELGVCDEPPVFEVPNSIQNDWILELSPHPLFIPAFYYFGNGISCSIPATLWARLGQGEYWARIGNGKGTCFCAFHWRVR